MVGTQNRLAIVWHPKGQTALVHPVAVQLRGGVGVGGQLQLVEALLGIVLVGSADLVVGEQRRQRVEAEHHPEELVKALENREDTTG